MVKENKEQAFALCTENKDCEDLEKRKIYQVLPDDDAEKEGYLRVIDESGEDYLYPESYFVLVQRPLFRTGEAGKKTRRKLIRRSEWVPVYPFFGIVL